METGPIFIGGLAHSGKTTLRLMLSSHPDLVLTRKTYMWPKFYKRYGDLAQSDNFERCLTAMLRQTQIQKLEPDPNRIRQVFWQGPTTYARLFALFHQHYAEKLGKSRWGDQLGGVERYADLIFSAYPGAKMVHMVRDPRSRYQVAKTHIRSRQGKTGWDTARWLHSARLAMQNQGLYPDSYKVVRYETLMAHSEETLRQIRDFLGVAFVKADQNRIPDTNNGTSGRLSRYEVAFTQSYTSRQMSAFDYPLRPVDFSFGERLRFYVVDWPINALGMVAWRTLKSRPFTEI